METILVTDSLFIDARHEELLRNAGFAVERLDKPRAGEAELCEAIRGKAGYILGGVEDVTPVVIHAADELRASRLPLPTGATSLPGRTSQPNGASPFHPHRPPARTRTEFGE